MKILALDIGDKWTGTAISDILGMLARPYKTIETYYLERFLSETIKTENIEVIVVGYAKTLRGTESAQTKKILETKERLAKEFDMVQWELWDERLSSKRAQGVRPSKTKEDKKLSHSLAAAFILDSYLAYLQVKKSE